MASPNWKNQTIFTGDNLDVMHGMNSESVDLIYLDPPFNSNANYAAPIGSQAAGAEFKDTWGLDDVDIEWHDLIRVKHRDLYVFLESVKGIHGDSMMSYLIYMIPRMMEMHRILKSTGSIYVHIDPMTSHYWKIILDQIFGKDNFLNEVIWHYGKWTNSAGYFQRNHDVILYYAKQKGSHTFNKLFSEEEKDHYKKGWHSNVIRVADEPVRQLLVYDRKKAEERIVSGKYDRIIYREGRVTVALPDVMNISIIGPKAKERTGYPTQKPLALMRRIIDASSNDGDVVFDPFCGCASTLVAAEGMAHPRQWVGIDISNKAVELVKFRLHNQIGVSAVGVIARTDIPKRTDLGKIPKYNAPENKTELYGIQEGHCTLCEGYFPARNLTIEHLLAVSKGGSDHIDNLQLLCQACNSEKGTYSQAEALARHKRKFNFKQPAHRAK